MIKDIIGWTSEFAQWTHQSIKEIPVAGHVYTKFNDNVSAPLWDLGCKGKDIAAPHFKQFFTFFESKIRRNPIIVIVALATVLAFIVRAFYKRRSDSN